MIILLVIIVWVIPSFVVFSMLSRVPKTGGGNVHPSFVWREDDHASRYVGQGTIQFPVLWRKR